jgi:hypothetical protein
MALLEWSSWHEALLCSHCSALAVHTRAACPPLPAADHWSEQLPGVSTCQLQQLQPSAPPHDPDLHMYAVTHLISATLALLYFVSALAQSGHSCLSHHHCSQKQWLGPSDPQSSQVQLPGYGLSKCCLQASSSSACSMAQPTGSCHLKGSRIINPPQQLYMQLSSRPAGLPHMQAQVRLQDVCPV